MIILKLDLGAWMYQLLTDWGVPKTFAEKFDETIMIILLIVLAIIVKYISQAIIGKSMHKIVDKTPFKLDSLLIQHKVFHYILDLLPAIFVLIALPYTFIKAKSLLNISQKICIIYMIFIISLGINGLLLTFLDYYNEKKKNIQRPIKGLIQVFQVTTFFLCAIIIISVIIGKSPGTLLAGLGASAAILMLVFKDSILGFVAGVQLSMNNMLRPGDWITIPSANINGIVQEITLNTVKVQNFDNTLSTIPPYSLVNGSFQNWRGMVDSAGRRVNKLIYLNILTIKFCTPDLIAKINKAVPLLADYKYDENNVPTNAQVFRTYIDKYLRSLPEVNTDLDIIISQQQMTGTGIPIQVYFFSRNKVWAPFEVIQSNIFDHLIAMVPQFELQVFQYSPDSVYVPS